MSASEAVKDLVASIVVLLMTYEVPPPPDEVQPLLQQIKQQPLWMETATASMETSMATAGKKQIYE